LSLTKEEDPIANLLYALKSSESKRQYPRRFKMFLDFLKLEGPLEEQAKQFLIKARQDPQWVQDNLRDFIAFQIERVGHGKIAESTISNYYKATKLFCEMNGSAQLINWKLITRGMPRGRQAAIDRAPTIEEIHKLVEYPDRRIKPIVYTMISSGVRIGAWDYLQWKHITPLTNDKGEVIAAKLIVYAGDREEYYTFITAEAFLSLKEWMDFRASYGEKVSGESWVMRDIWQTTNIDYGAKWGLATNPKRLKSSGIKRLLERALWEQGIRKPLAQGAKRHEWKAAHGFRKFYKSRAEQVMKPINVELTMGHSIGISASYYKPTEKEVLEDYLRAVDLLTINGNTIVLQRKVTELEEKSKDSDYIIKGKLEEKEKEIQQLTQRESVNTDAIATLSDQVTKLVVEVQELKRQNQS
jgi:hypothetical protein